MCSSVLSACMCLVIEEDRRGIVSPGNEVIEVVNCHVVLGIEPREQPVLLTDESSF